jgi:hypothetical protein
LVRHGAPCPHLHDGDTIFHELLDCLNIGACQDGYDLKTPQVAPSIVEE